FSDSSARLAFGSPRTASHWHGWCTLGTVIEITVNLGARSYPIVVGAGVLGSIGERLRGVGVGSRVALVSDPVVAPLFARTVAGRLQPAGFRVTEGTVPA